MLNIVIPMAGRGSRFKEAGYIEPKPFIDVNGEYMIELVVRNISPKCEHRFIFLCLKEHLESYTVAEKLNKLSENIEIISVDHVTEGAACTVLLSKEFINSDEPLMIANSDQYVDIDINDYLAQADKYDGMIMTMTADDPKWSFIRIDNENHVSEVREKEVISNEATVGIYNFTHGKDFVKYAQDMIEKNERVNGEFYVAPAYNAMIKSGKTVSYYNIGAVGAGMYGLGTPNDLNEFLRIKKQVSHAE